MTTYFTTYTQYKLVIATHRIWLTEIDANKVRGSFLFFDIVLKIWYFTNSSIKSHNLDGIVIFLIVDLYVLR